MSQYDLDIIALYERTRVKDGTYDDEKNQSITFKVAASFIQNSFRLVCQPACKTVCGGLLHTHKQASDDATGEFKIIPQSVASDILRHDIACFVGLLNRNENSELRIDFALSNDIVIGGSLFQHPDIHKYSRTSADGVTRNQIDHCLVNRKWRTSLMDVRSHRGADVGSDRSLMIAKFKVKLKKNVKQALYPNPPFDSYFITQ
ncbi:hypothetical protein QYM36_000366 [Artemia franciscana]|uniref:Uncharacterized protein n=1 Tax=Artemia franciscana TaxID=6661 RepID=A0AA88ICM8_ARTSF|nr:hypothetical protein QYM36_000366 [Artemia franciscana]